jgi:hypothetical protein
MYEDNFVYVGANPQSREFCEMPRPFIISELILKWNREEGFIYETAEEKDSAGIG